MDKTHISYPIIVHCHLRWDGVWQRPQQFLSRLSQNHRVLFCEGPILVEDNHEPRFELKQVPEYPNVTVMQTFFPASRFSDGQWVDAERLRLLKDAVNGPLKGKFSQPVQWFYDPMAVVAYAKQMDEIAIVYDCMDELSKFKFAPPEIIERERLLLKYADVVFTGGRKMREAKQPHNKNCHFYGCGVDVKHFGTARLDSTEVPADTRSLKKPVLGYFGVVDERLDYELIAKLAAAADWTVVMIGPVVKVDPATLPQHPNIKWLGRREYDQLPAYTKGWDVCLMPFAMNEHTEYINPTKALEYMATARPIVSSPVPDVVSNFSSVVKVASNADEFIEFCKKEAAAPDREAVQRGIVMSNDNQWESIVAKLENHIAEAFDRRAKANNQEALQTQGLNA
jgi:glycosyltransferase involved in cell wall biosynthesis